MREVELDQFFTDPEDAARFIAKVDELYPLSGYDVVLEPSAGDGSFFKLMPENRVGIDLEPLAEGIEKMDFFDYWPPLFSSTCVIGNPPFGRRGSLAKDFFNHCAKYADVIAFVVPAIFSKPSFYKSLDKMFHLEYQEYVDRFNLPDGTPHPVKCVFQVWKKKGTARVDEVRQNKHPDFEMTHRHISRTTKEELEQLCAEYDFCMGQISGKVMDTKDATKGSQFFVKGNVPGVREVFEKMDFSENSKYHVGATSLAVADVVEKYLEIK